MNDYVHGSIASLTLTNFQTFEYQKLSFGPALNLIAAPNGSGKSSIANAIAFIFSGSPKTIGKSKDIREFIKFGTETAIIEAEIWKVDLTTRRKINLKRTINQNGKSLFYIESKQVSVKEYHAFIDTFDINVDNLCAFLPQERVSEFCRMTGKELLQEILRNTDIDLNEMYAAQEDLLSIDQALNTKSKNRAVVVGSINNLQAKLKEIKEIEEMEVRLERLKQRLIYFEYEEERAIVLEHKERVTVATNRIAKAKAEITELEEKIQLIKGNDLFKDYNVSVDILLAQNNKLKSESQNLKNSELNLSLKVLDYNSIIKQQETTGKKVLSKTQELESAVTEKSNLEKEFSKETKSILAKLGEYNIDHNYQVDIQNFERRNLERLFPDTSSIDKKIEDKQVEYRRIKTQSEILSNSIDDLEKQKVAYSEQKNQRLEQLKKYHYDSYVAVQWLRQNKDIFEDEILEPSYLHINIHKDYKMEVESVLGFQTLSSFLVKNQRDFIKLGKILKDEKNLTVNLATCEGPTGKSVDENNSNISTFFDPKFNSAFFSRKQISETGIDGLVIDFIETREEYKSFFNQFGSFNAIPVCKKEMNESDIFNSIKNCKKAIIAGRYCEINRSKYDSNTITNTNIIKDKNIFKSEKIEIEMITKELEEKKVERENNRKSLNLILSEKMQFEQEKQNVKDCFDLTSIMKVHYNYKRTIGNINILNQELKNLQEVSYEANLSDNLKDQDALKKAARTIMSNIKEILNIKSVPKFNLEKIKDLKLDLENTNRNLIYLKSISATETESLLRIKKDLEVRMERFSAVKEKIKSFPKIKDVEGLPELKQEVEDEIHLLSTKLNLLNKDSSIKKEYKAKERILDSLSGDISQLEKKRDFLQVSISQMVMDTKLKVYEYLRPIKHKFKRLFERFKAEGDIELKTKWEEDGPKNVQPDKEWELEILVKFRNTEQLEKLSSFRQSGGEKSLTTILFLLSLQQSHQAPFRLVDEINQGMDAVNEKLVFEILKELSSHSQFFIITPKLLDDLVFSETTTAVVLYGGIGVTKDLEVYANRILS